MNMKKKAIPAQVEPVIRLSPALNLSMAICRKDLTRQMADTDFCETCLLLIQCNAQEIPTFEFDEEEGKDG